MTTEEHSNEAATVDEQMHDFHSFVAETYQTGIEKLDQMLADAGQEFDRIQNPPPEPPPDEDATTYRERHDSEPDAVPCSDSRFHDDHLWSHPDGHLRHCLGVRDATVPIAATRDDLENVPGFPSARMFVLDEDKTYEHDGNEWRSLDDVRKIQQENTTSVQERSGAEDQN